MDHFEDYPQYSLGDMIATLLHLNIKPTDNIPIDTDITNNMEILALIGANYDGDRLPSKIAGRK